MIILKLILWMVYASLEGIRESYYYHLNCGHHEPIQKNLHPLFTVERMTVLSFIFMGFNNVDVQLLAFLTSCFLVFPFFHDSVYYYMRNKLNPLIYPKRFFDQSTTSTAFSTKFFTPVVRVVCAVVGIGLVVMFH